MELIGVYFLFLFTASLALIGSILLVHRYRTTPSLHRLEKP